VLGLLKMGFSTERETRAREEPQWQDSCIGFSIRVAKGGGVCEGGDEPPAVKVLGFVSPLSV
jgi:hypothetical protein